MQSYVLTSQITHQYKAVSQAVCRLTGNHHSGSKINLLKETIIIVSYQVLQRAHTTIYRRAIYLIIFMIVTAKKCQKNFRVTCLVKNNTNKTTQTFNSLNINFPLDCRIRMQASKSKNITHPQYNLPKKLRLIKISLHHHLSVPYQVQDHQTTKNGLSPQPPTNNDTSLPIKTY